MTHWLRELLSITLVVCLLAPTAAVAQAPPPAAPVPRAVGAAPPAWVGRSVPGPDYRLGNGDVLDVQVAGRLEVTRLQVTVDPEGNVTVPPLGAIEVGDLTVLQANRRIQERARALLRFSEVSVTLLTPRVFEVVVSGEIERPGTYQAAATQRLHELILIAGGITPRGSQRHVRILGAGPTQEVDLLRFELRGDLEENPLVQQGMRVHVPARRGAVQLSGAVRRPGEYELGPNPVLGELLELTGGLTVAGAASDARLTRVGAEGRKETFSIDLRTAMARPGDVPLQPGDTLFVPPLSVLQDVVEVRGAFAGTQESGKTQTAGKPTIVQRFELARGERVLDVVTRAGGAAAFADLRLAFVDRVAAAGPRQRIPIDLHRLLVEKDDTQNILLQNGDVLTVPVAEDRVYIVGEVRAPGAQDYRPDFTPREYLALAGGPSARAKLPLTTVTFRNGRTYAMSEAPPLEPGAVVTVPEVAVKWWQDYVQIAGVIASLITAYTGIFILFGGADRVRLTGSD